MELFHRSRFSSRPWLATLICFLLLVMLTGCAGETSPTATPLAASGAFAPWHSVLTTAKEEATKIDKGAVLMWVTSDNADCTNSDPIRTDFIFVLPSGHRMSIVVEDTMPPTALQIQPEYDMTSPLPTSEMLSDYSTLENSIEIGPRDVCSAVEAAKHLQFQKDSLLTCAIFFDREVSQINAPNWSFEALNKDGSSMTFEVSAITGQVVETKATPSPSD